MNDREFFRLMQLIPEEYPEEAAAFLTAHGQAANSGRTAAAVRQKKPELHFGIIRRFLLPAGAAACLAALIITGIRTGLREQPLTEASSAPEMTLIAAQTETTPAETALTEAAVQRTVAVTQTPAQNGTAPPVQSTASAVTTAEEHQPETASRNQDTTAKPQTAAAQEPQTAPETPADSVPAPDPDYLPGDVNMDGKADVEDVQILMKEYRAVVVEGKESTLTPQQIALGDIYPNTAEEDPAEIVSLFGIDTLNDDTGIPIIATDYPISYIDYNVLLAYWAEMRVVRWNRTLDLFTIADFISYHGLPPAEEQQRFQTPPVIMQGDTLPADSVTVHDFGDYPVHPKGWAMQYAKVTKPGDFTLWYDGTDDYEGYKILIFGESGYSETQLEDKRKLCESNVERGKMQRFTIGDQTVYRSLTFNPRDDSDSWRENLNYSSRSALHWYSGEYCIAVYTQEQYPDDVIQQIAESFAVYPAN